MISVSARAEFNEDGSLNPDVDGYGYRATATYVDQFANDTLGVALGVAYQSSPSQVQRFNAWGYPNDAGFAVLGGLKPFARSVDLDRLGAVRHRCNGNHRPNGTPRLTCSTPITASGFRSAASNSRSIPAGVRAPRSLPTAAAAFPDSVTFTNVQPVVRNDYDRKDTETFAVGWNTEYETDAVSLMLDVAYSSSDRRLQQIESYSGLNFAANGPNAGDTVTYTRNDSGFPYTFSSGIDYSNTNLIQLTDPRGWGGGAVVQAGFINDTSTQDELWSVRGEGLLPGRIERLHRCHRAGCGV